MLALFILVFYLFKLVLVKWTLNVKKKLKQTRTRLWLT